MKKIAKPNVSLEETGKVELNIRVPHLSPGAVIHITRDLRRTLENSSCLNLMDTFIETRTVEYAEVPREEAG